MENTGQKSGQLSISPSNALSLLVAFAEQEKRQRSPLVSKGGIVSDVSRVAVAARGLSDDVSLGDNVLIDCGRDMARGEIIRVNEDHVLIKPFDETIVPALNASVFPNGPLTVSPDKSWRGRVVNALGEAIDDLGPIVTGEKKMPVETHAVPALKRARVGKGLRTGVKVIDIFTPLCFGQRIGIFAGSGVGKSTLLAMMTQTDDFDTVVLALTGERGREVRDMLDDTMKGKLSKVVTVVATGDESPMMRRLAPAMATTIAEYFCSLGDNVLLMVDSITRYALAAREVAIAAGEPPVSRGFPPSVFSDLPRLLERAGPGPEGKGSITGVYAVLVDGDDHNDPIADAIRGILDGHIVLDRAIAAQGRYPAIDIPGSISRLAPHSWTAEQKKLVRSLKEMISRYEETRDLRAMGAYHPGSDPVLDQAVVMVPRIYAAMNQSPDTPVSRDPYDDLAKALRAQAA
ncbi:C-terminal [Bartonella choladocola]|uniref:Flagellum-specific ATP synthase n=1 Tax=Bartonella choladocola TaxID=2750995 RepID=A0A1U9MFZ4_9HYPH|nr:MULTISPECIES: flagellar protein export ATPase FliI [Bartonella]AQT46653.1 flagellum-specific ATP synthase [Bartonella choladocola]